MIGSQLGPWLVERELGHGGMGTVYLACKKAGPPELPEQAAIKVLAPELAVSQGFLKRFQREIDILRQLDHPNIVRFLGWGEKEGQAYFAMEYVQGPNYETLWKQQGRLAWAEVLDLAMQVSPALKHAHDRGIVHRDLKPSNLLRQHATPGTNLVKLTDFGIARLFTGEHLTVTGSVVGTAEYLSPEQAAGKPVTKRSDLYSLGVVLYTLITGRTPFEGDSLSLLHKHRFGQFDLPSRYVPDLPPDFEAIICQLLEKDPARRVPDGAVLHKRLDSLRRKLDRQEANRENPFRMGYEAAEGRLVEVQREQAARLMSTLMREELQRDLAGGPIKRFFNQPWVLIVLFVLTLGTIIWTFWPASAETLYRQGAALMESDNPADWREAWDDYLGPLEERYPDHPYQKELAEYRAMLQAGEAAREAYRRARRAGPMTEAQWFYQKGLRLRQKGDEQGARRVWQALITAFSEVPGELPWVRLAEQALAKKGKEANVRRQWLPVEQGIKSIAQLRKEGKHDQADAIRQALTTLYEDDPEGQRILKEKQD
jgi:hypothetical protein